jgi:hypothetical protein
MQMQIYISNFLVHDKSMMTRETESASSTNNTYRRILKCSIVTSVVNVM